MTAIGKLANDSNFFRNLNADLLGSSGSSKAEFFFTFDLSIPAFAQINPWRVFAITKSPLFLIIFLDSLCQQLFKIII